MLSEYIIYPSSGFVFRWKAREYLYCQFKNSPKGQTKTLNFFVFFLDAVLDPPYNSANDYDYFPERKTLKVKQPELEYVEWASRDSSNQGTGNSSPIKCDISQQVSRKKLIQYAR